MVLGWWNLWLREAIPAVGFMVGVWKRGGDINVFCCLSSEAYNIIPNTLSQTYQIQRYEINVTSISEIDDQLKYGNLKPILPDLLSTPFGQPALTYLLIILPLHLGIIITYTGYTILLARVCRCLHMPPLSIPQAHRLHMAIHQLLLNGLCHHVCRVPLPW